MTEIEETLRALIRKRGTIKAQLTLFEKYVLPFESLDIETVHKLKVLDLQHRVTSADALYHKFDSIQSEIECTADDEYNQYSEREDFENKYYCLMAKANSFLKEYESKSLTASDSSSVGTNNNTQLKGVKLPEIKLPKFDGSYDTWLEFRDIFESLIHCNTEINPIQKFHYLRASLVGSAARVVQALEFTANNYDTAWSVLCDRYSNEKILVQNHLKAIVNHETIQSASSIKIRNLYENLCKHVSSLNQLGEPTDSWDTILIFIMSGKLDKITSQEWEKQRANLQNVKLTDFKDFLKVRANLLETIEYNFEKQNIQNKPRNVTTKRLLSQSETVIKGNHSNGRNSCLYCKNDHSLFHCPNFLKLAIKDRFAKAKEMRLCLNCLRQNHMAKNCSWNGCKTCGQKHNSILHFPKGNTNAAMSIGQDEVVEREESSTNCTLAVAQHALLSTAQVQVRETKNSSNFVTVRALLDSGSQSSFITSSLCERLNLPKTTVKLAISGISENISYANQRCNINIRSINDAYSFNLSCFVLDKITNDIPERAIDIANLNIPLQIKLADPEFHIPQRVDMLIGADAFWQLLIIGRITLENTSILLQNTRLGWLVAGSMSEPAVKTRCNLSHNISVQEQLTKFWEVEEIDVKRSLSIEEEACEEHFVEHVAKSNDGRYIVDLPLKEAPENLGDSRVTAIKRFESLEKRFAANDVYRKLYTDFLLEYGRLELCAALVLSQLTNKVLNSIDLKVDAVHCWTDSTIVLGWLRTSPNSLKTFVSNRVAEIQKLTHSFEWRHVPSCDNPADIVSRGLYPKQLVESKMWFCGPRWLLSESDKWPNLNPSLNEIPEKKQAFVTTMTIKSFNFDKFSSLIRLKRSFAFVLRFISNCRSNQADKNLGPLTVDEIHGGFMLLLKLAQRESFPVDYKALENSKQLGPKSKILSLHPFIENGLTRVGGRLSNSSFPYEKKFPILLSPKHHLTKLILEHEHKRLLHAGPQLLLSNIRESLWPISCRNACRIVRECIKCARYNAQHITPIMGNLPATRLRSSGPFSIVGVDYAGPFLMRDRRGRGHKVVKCWVALFVCFSTKAMHLELVLSLSTEDFLQAFKRFISRRGKPSEVYSDNGTNFVKANKELIKICDFFKENESIIKESISALNIKWHFIPTNSPHFEGIWEAGVKTVKYHLRRVLGCTSLFFFDFQTLLIRIEAVVNSRPLYPLSSNPNDLTSLTPAHFLIGRAITSIPECSIADLPDNRLSQYQLIQKMYEHFWSRWSKEYVAELQGRKRWKTNISNIEIGQFVLVMDDNLPPSHWRMGRIASLTYGKDDIPRVASIRTSNGNITRAVARLCILPVVSQDFQGGGYVPCNTLTNTISAVVGCQE